MDKETAQERKRLLKELGTLGNMIRGTLVHTQRRCGSKGCHCMTGGSVHDVRYLPVRQVIDTRSIEMIKSSSALGKCLTWLTN